MAVAGPVAGPVAEQDAEQDADDEAPRKETLGTRLAKARLRHKTRMLDGVGHPYPRVRRVVFSTAFEIFMSVVILLNCAVIGWQAELKSTDGQDAMLSVAFQLFFMAVFLLELVLRFLAWGWTMALEKENLLDIFLVVLSLVSLVKVEVIRKLLVLRTLRLIRLADMVQNRPGFEDMHSLLQGLKESLATMMWIYVVMAFILYFFGVLGTAIIGKDETFNGVPMASEYFGSVLKSMFTLFQVMTLDAWSGIVRDLMAVRIWVLLFFIAFLSIAVFVLMNLILAIIVEHTFAVGKATEKDRRNAAERETAREIEELREFFTQIDTDCSGKISRAELEQAGRDRKASRRLEKLNMSSRDIDELWDILDDGDGELDLGEFVKGILKLTGEAKAKEMMQLSRELGKLEESVDSIEESVTVSGGRMKHMEQLLARTRADISALSRTVVRAKDQVKQAARTQSAE